MGGLGVRTRVQIIRPVCRSQWQDLDLVGGAGSVAIAGASAARPARATAPERVSCLRFTTTAYACVSRAYRTIAHTLVRDSPGWAIQEWFMGRAYASPLLWEATAEQTGHPAAEIRVPEENSVAAM